MDLVKQRKYDIAYLKMALEWAKLSHCKRRQVGDLTGHQQVLIMRVKMMKTILNGMFFMPKQML